MMDVKLAPNVSYTSTEPSENLRFVSLFHIFPVLQLPIVDRVLLPSLSPLLVENAGIFAACWTGIA